MRTWTTGDGRGWEGNQGLVRQPQRWAGAGSPQRLEGQQAERDWWGPGTGITQRKLESRQVCWWELKPGRERREMQKDVTRAESSDKYPGFPFLLLSITPPAPPNNFQVEISQNGSLRNTVFWVAASLRHRIEQEKGKRCTETNSVKMGRSTTEQRTQNIPKAQVCNVRLLLPELGPYP